jgi:3-(3-hydroxy-phenyl)propionate hydroxylase
VRKKLEIEFEGYTWPERFLVLTTSVEFDREMACSYRSYLADPEEWGNLFKIAGDDLKGRWRAVFPVRGEELTDEFVMSEAEGERRLRRILQRDEPFPVLHRNLYRVHQRVAAAFSKHRVFLAGDACHVNNPIGGLGLNCGIHDALELAETLEAARDGGSGDILGRYERRRRKLNIDFVQQQTIMNKKRLEEKDPEVVKQNLRDLTETAADPARHHAFLHRSSLLGSVKQSKTID